MRLHLAEEKQSIYPLDIEMAIEKCASLNADPLRWATLEILSLGKLRTVKVDWGFILSDGTKERALETITFHLVKEGEVMTNGATHV